MQKKVALLAAFLGFPALVLQAGPLGEDVVRNKKYPKAGQWELNTDLGVILNQSFVDSNILHIGVNYFWSENWGLGVEGILSQNVDREERHCIEHFYNDSQDLIGPACPTSNEDPALHLTADNGQPIRGANFGPAYIGIREINQIMAATVTWAPLYGKQLFSTVMYFDLFLTMGLGLTDSTFYPESLTLRDGRLSRGSVDKVMPLNECPQGADFPGVCPNEAGYEDLIGTAGRPDPELQSNPTLVLGIGQKFHFSPLVHVQVELRSYSLLGTESGFDSLMMTWFGLGLRL